MFNVCFYFSAEDEDWSEEVQGTDGKAAGNREGECSKIQDKPEHNDNNIEGVEVDTEEQCDGKYQ